MMPTLAELNMAAQYGGTDFQNQDWAAILKAIQGYNPDAYDQNYSGTVGLTGNNGWTMDGFQPNGLVQLTKLASNQTGDIPGGFARYDTVDIDPNTGLPTQQWQQYTPQSNPNSIGNWLGDNGWMVPLALTGAAGMGWLGGGEAASTSGAALNGVGNLDAYVAAQTGGASLPAGADAAVAGTAGTGAVSSGAGTAGTTAAGTGAATAASSGGGVLSSIGSTLSNMSPGTLGTLGSLVSGALGAGTALNAGNLQADAANNAVGLQKYIYDQTSQNVAPWLAAGKSSLGTLMSGVNSGQFNPAPYTATANLQTLGGTPSFQTVANAPKLTSYGPATQMQQFGSVGAMQAYKDYVAQNPYTGPGAWDASKFQSDPGYQFQLQQGLDALTNRASIAGGMNSNNMKGLIGYAQQLANTDYQQAFQNYQTEAQRGLQEYQTGLQDYMQQFLLGQNVNTLNNQLTQQQFQDAMATTSANNQATQTDNQNRIQVTGLNNQNIVQDLQNAIAAAGFNNTWRQTGFEDTAQQTAFNNQVAQQGYQNANTTTGLNNQNLQTQFGNLAQLSQVGLNAGLQQGSLGAQYANAAGNLMTGGAAATAAGRVGAANAIGSGIGDAYNAWLMQQMMGGGNSYGNWLGSNAGILSQGVPASDLWGLG
jgi:hypothetical protein